MGSSQNLKLSGISEGNSVKIEAKCFVD